jgi:heterodisulfide reductase subunit C
LSSGAAARGPLAFVVLAATGEDIRGCINCSSCDDITTQSMDLTIGELMRLAARDDPQALSSRTLWAGDDLLFSRLECQAGIDLPAVILTLRREAELRGLA